MIFLVKYSRIIREKIEAERIEFVKMNEEKEIQKQKEYIEKVKKLNKEKNLKYAILTMGCQLNENDSEKISGMIEQMGYTKTENPKEADLNLFNTCCVRENAEDKLFGKLGELKKVKEENGTIIAIGGCMMQEKHITNKIKESYRSEERRVGKECRSRWSPYH